MSMDGDRQQDQPLSLRWRTQAISVATGAIGGITINVVSDDLGYRWVVILWMLLTAPCSAWWLRGLAPQAPLVRWFDGVCLGGTLLAAGWSVVGPASWAPYTIAVAAILVVAVMVRATGESIATLLPGMLLVGGGVALAGAGITGTDGVLATVVRIVAGVAIAVAGVLLIRRAFRGVGIAITAIGVLSLGVAMVFATGMFREALLMALVFGSLGVTGVILGSAVAVRPNSISEMATAVGPPIALCLSVVNVALGVVAVYDGRILLAVADFAAAAIVAGTVVASLLHNGVDARWSVCAIGLPCIVDGVETAARGNTLGGTVSVVIGVFLLAACAVRLSGRATRLWRYATTAPPDAATVPPTLDRVSE